MDSDFHGTEKGRGFLYHAGIFEVSIYFKYEFQFTKNGTYVPGVPDHLKKPAHKYRLQIRVHTP